MAEKVEQNALESLLIRRLDSVKHQTDDDLLPRLPLPPSLRSTALSLRLELAPFALAHVADVQHEAVKSTSEEDLVFVVGGL